MTNIEYDWEPAPEPKVEPEPESVAKPEPELEPVARPEPKPEPEPAAKPEPKPVPALNAVLFRDAAGWRYRIVAADGAITVGERSFARRSAAKRAARADHPTVMNIEYDWEPAPEPKRAPEPVVKVEPKPAPTARVEPEPTPKPKRAPTPKVEPEPVPVPKVEEKPKPTPKPKRAPTPKMESEPVPVPKVEEKPEPKLAPTPKVEPEPTPVLRAFVFHDPTGWRYRIVAADGTVTLGRQSFGLRSSAKRAAHRDHPTVAEVEYEAKSAAPKLEPKPEPKIEPKPVRKPVRKVWPKPAAVPTPKPAAKVVPKPAAKVVPKPAAKVEPKPVPKVEPKPAPTREPRPARDAVPAVAMGSVIEREPDHDSRDRGRIIRLGLGTAVALVLLVVLVVVVVDSTKSGVGEPGGSKPTTSTAPSTTTRAIGATTSDPVEFTPVLLPSGMVVTRSWRLAGTNGDTFTAGIEVRNGTPSTKTDAVVEVIPKQLAQSVADVTFFGGTPNTILADPVVSFDVTVKPGKRVRVGYRIHVEPDGTDTSRLLWWKSNRDAQQQALDIQLSTPVPKGAKIR